MLSYPIELEDDDGTILATSPDFPELTTFGDDRDEALERAIDALEEAIAARIHTAQEVPPPSRGRNRATLPTLTAIKVILYQGMRDQGSERRNSRGVSAGTFRRWTAFLTCATAPGSIGWTPRYVPSGDNWR